MAVTTINALKAKFAAGKYPTAADFADLIDTCSQGGGTSIPIFTITNETPFDEELDNGVKVYNIIYNQDFQSLGLAPNDLVIIKNKTSEPINVGYQYSTLIPFNVPASGAILLIKIDPEEVNNDYYASDNLELVGVINSDSADTTSQKGFFVFKTSVNFSFVYDTFEPFDENNVPPEGTVCIIVNNGEENISVTCDYDANITVTIAPHNAVMFIHAGSVPNSRGALYPIWAVVSNPIN